MELAYNNIKMVDLLCLPRSNQISRLHRMTDTHGLLTHHFSFKPHLQRRQRVYTFNVELMRSRWQKPNSFNYPHLNNQPYVSPKICIIYWARWAASQGSNYPIKTHGKCTERTRFCLEKKDRPLLFLTIWIITQLKDIVIHWCQIIKFLRDMTFISKEREWREWNYRLILGLNMFRIVHM